MKALCALVVSTLLLFGLSGCSLEDNQELAQSVQQSIEVKMADPFKIRGVEVQDLTLRHQQAERYQGELRVREQGEEKSYSVEVQFDGTYFIWKMPGWEPEAS